MAIFNSYVKLPEGRIYWCPLLPTWRCRFDSSPSRKPGDAARAAVFCRLFRAVAVVACHVMSSTILVISDTSVLKGKCPVETLGFPWFFSHEIWWNMVPRGPARVPYQFWNHPIFKPKYNSSKIHQCHGCFRQHCWKQNMIWVDVEEFLQTTPSIWVCLKVPLKSHGWWSCSPLNGHKSGGKFHHSETNACALA